MAIHSTWNLGSNWPHWSENASFQSIFAGSASAPTPSERSSINTTRKSTTRFPVSLQQTSQGRIQRGQGGHTPLPQLSIEWIFLRKKRLCWDCSLYQGPQICQKCVGGRGSAPDPAMGAHDSPPDLLVGWGGDTPSAIPTPLDLAPSALSFCGPQCKILATSLKHRTLLLNGRFPYKIALRLKKVCYKVSLCKNR